MMVIGGMGGWRWRRRRRRTSAAVPDVTISQCQAWTPIMIMLLILLQVPGPVSSDEPDGYPPHCNDTKSCDRELCDDSRAVVPEGQAGCYQYADVMNCYKHCRDTRTLRTCYEERARNGSQEYCLLKLPLVSVLQNRTFVSGKYTYPNSTHLGLPCSLKCRTAPKFWSCVHSCDHKGCFKSFKKCEREGNPTEDCYISNLIKELQTSPECVVRYTSKATGMEDDVDAMLEIANQPNLCIYGKSATSSENVADTNTQVATDIRSCSSATTAIGLDEGNVGVVEACYRKKLMKQQLELCLEENGKFTPKCNKTYFTPPGGASVQVTGKGFKACHEHCLRLLTKPYCYIPCERNTTLKLKKTCEQDCHLGDWPRIGCLCSSPVEPDSITEYLLDADNQRIVDFIANTNKSCIDKKKQDLHKCYAGQIYTRDREMNKLQNCKSGRYVSEFANRIMKMYNDYRAKTHMRELSISFGSDMKNFADHYTHFDCKDACSSNLKGDSLTTCMMGCVRKQRINDEMNKVCSSISSSQGSETNFLRSEIAMWCMIKYSMARGDTVWTFDAYVSVIKSPVDYENLVNCEKWVREAGEKSWDSYDDYRLPGSFFTMIANITYELDKSWCSECVNSSLHSSYHPDDMDHARCSLNCYRNIADAGCPALPTLAKVVHGTMYSKCSWRMDYSLTESPNKIWNTYFDERPAFDASSNLKQPNTEKYLSKTRVGASEGHYVFPYFIVFRPTCEDRFYEEEVYKFIASGATPVIKLTYIPNTSRQIYQKLVRANFQGALINLERTEAADKYIIANPLELEDPVTKKLDGKYGCHLGLCYPAFVVPQILLHLPIFGITVYSQGVFSAVDSWGYSFSLHSRKSTGKGRMVINNNDDTPTAEEFFPLLKSQLYEDTQFAYLWNRLPDSGYKGVDCSVTNNKKVAKCQGPELEHLTDHNCKGYRVQESLTLGGNANLPLDTEDFMRVQYTHGNVPQVVMAGFYDPNLVITADPDFSRFQLTRWNYDTTTGTKEDPTARLFHGRYSCLSQQYKLGGYKKPLYSYVDRSDPDFWLQFYRLRYKPKNYEDPIEAQAIFDIVSLEDRLLLVTTGGLVSLYQNINATAAQGKAWEAGEADSLERCFKIVRTTRRTQQHSDTVIAITYDYQVLDTEKNVIKDVNQEVWVGKYLTPGEPLIWHQISSANSSDGIKEESQVNMGGDKLGTAVSLPPKKIVSIPVERREMNPKSQIEAICYKAYRSKMEKAEHIELIEDFGWCNAIDATPVTAADQSIQVLVRMRTYYSDGEANDTIPRALYFYVIASYDLDKSTLNWQIDSIIPRIPCQDVHRESIPNLNVFTSSYFKNELNKGCHAEEEFAKEEFQVFLHGMTYTKSYTQHLFLYGNKLLQSTDSGHTFVILRSFPARHAKYRCQKGGYHTIKLMTFDTKGHYAFLTSKRELWYGSLGSLSQVRLRPSSAHSVTLTNFYASKEVAEAVPFAVFFDSKDVLQELVAVVDTHGKVIRTTRRAIDEKSIVRVSHLLNKFSERSAKSLDMLKKEFNKYEYRKRLYDEQKRSVRPIPSILFKEFKYDQVDWSVFCPYASSSVYHNFSVLHARVLTFSFPSPRQHLDLGHPHIKTSLQTYQASTFRIMWNAFLNQPEKLYSNIDSDLFSSWIIEKTDAAVIGRTFYLSSTPSQHGILVLPTKYQRYNKIASDENRVFEAYYMDYDVIIRLEIDYSVSNDFTFNPVNYVHHRLSVIEINVENSNGSLIQIDTEREILAARATIRYLVHLKLKRNTGLQQRYSGRDGINVPITFHLVGGFGKCVPSADSGIKGDSITTSVTVGCPSSLELVLDWMSTVNSIKFRDHAAHYGTKPSECYQGEPFCFYVKYPLILHFHKFDYIKQVHRNFSGKFVMRIVGGGYSRDNLRDYTEEEQQAYNIPGVSDVSLVWNEWDRDAHKKVEHKEKKNTGRADSREVVLTAGVSSIQWACHTLSPCARIVPRGSMESIYYFKVFISNRGVDNDTLCLFEKEFVILLYGFPPSTEIQLLTTLIFYFLIVLIVYIAFICARNNRKIWNSVTEKFSGWVQVVIDALPKGWTRTEEEEEEETEAEKQKRRDEIILSLQGHLNVPRLIHKATARKGEAKAKNEDGESPNSSDSSGSASIGSSLSGEESDQVLNPIVERPAAQTWTDMIYEQVISRRLAAIIERNKQETEELRRKAAFEHRHKL